MIAWLFWLALYVCGGACLVWALLGDPIARWIRRRRNLRRYGLEE